MVSDESGSVLVEYALIAAAMVLVLAAVIGLADPAMGRGWVEKTRRSFFVSGRPGDLSSLLREVRER